MVNQRNALFRKTGRRSLSESRYTRSDNTFRTAIDFGTVRSSSEPSRIRLNGTVGPADAADVFKIKVKPGVAFSSDKTRWNIAGGRVKLSFYTQHPLLTNNEITLAGSRTFRGSDSSQTTPGLFNDSQDTATLYFKLTTSSTSAVNYDIRVTSIP